MKNISIKAILIGLVALILLDGIGGYLLALSLAGEVSGDIIREFQSNTVYLIFRMVVGAIALIGAGYITEKIAKKTHILNSSIVGVISIILTVLLLNDSYPIWYLVISYLYQWPSAIIGGFMVNKNFKHQ
jgi:hypothetical protein